VEGTSILNGTYTLSWTGTATATVNSTPVTNGGQVVLTGGVNTTVRFTNGTFALAQLERGSVVTPFEIKPRSVEVEACQRYYVRGTSYGFGYAGAAGPTRVISHQLPVSMRVNPNFTILSGSAVNMNGGETFQAITTYSFGFFATAQAPGGVSYDLGFSANAEL